MSKTEAKYLFLLGWTAFIFTNFIACGAKMYKVSLEDDVQPPNSASQRVAENGIHSSSGWTNLPIAFHLGQRISPAQKVGLLLAMKTWETAVGRSLFDFRGPHSGLTGDSFPDLCSSLKDPVNGHYLDENWVKTGKSKFVLATTIWDNDPRDPGAIRTADIRYNDSEYLFGDSLQLTATERKEVVDMQSLALHELGHLLGLAHMDEAEDPLSIMNPALFIGEGLTSRKLSEGDIERIQNIYGCLGLACDRVAILEVLEKQEQAQHTRIAAADISLPDDTQQGSANKLEAH